MKHLVGLDVSMKEAAIWVVGDAGQLAREGNGISAAGAIAATVMQTAPGSGSGRYCASPTLARFSDAVLRDLFASLLSVLSGLKHQRCAVDCQLVRYPREDAACRIVSTALGAGSLAALAVATVVNDPARFRSACDVDAYPALTPKRRQSGEVDMGGRMSKAGEAATVILYRASPSPELKPWGLRVNTRPESWKARVALVRRRAVTPFAI